MSSLACRLCGSSRLSCVGSIADSDFFAGRVLESPVPGGDLWRCESCGSMFRHPVLPKQTYAKLYTSGATDQWKADVARNDLDMIRAQIAARRVVRAVLDVGCGGGGFLLSLPTSIKKFGVEPSTAASAAARQAGISIAAPLLEELQPGELFDVITIIDVIEHVADPIELLNQAVAHLAPGGSLIIATGDPMFVLWRRLFRSRFWYSVFPEHITFPSLRALSLWGRRHGLAPPTAQRIRYRRLSWWRATAHLTLMVAFLINPAILNTLLGCVQRLRGTMPPRRRYFSPGAPGVFTDHQVVTFVGKAAADRAQSITDQGRQREHNT